MLSHFLFLTLILFSSCSSLNILKAETPEVITIYSYRAIDEVRPLFDAFERLYPQYKIDILVSKHDLKDRLIREGKKTPADLIFTVDLFRIHELLEHDLLASPTSLSWAEKNIPTQYRDSNNKWFGLTKRARIFYIAKNRVDPKSLRTYLDLARPEWEGRICHRSFDHLYNVSLLSRLISVIGEDAAQNWQKSIVNHLAQTPRGGDRDQIRLIAEGVCDVTIGNTYYLGKMLHHPEQNQWADKVEMVFPDLNNEGPIVNLSVMAMTKFSKNRRATEKLMSFLSSEIGQRIYAEQNFEWPVNPKFSAPGLVSFWDAHAHGRARSLYSLEEQMNSIQSALEIINNL